MSEIKKKVENHNFDDIFSHQFKPDESHTVENSPSFKHGHGEKKIMVSKEVKTMEFSSETTELTDPFQGILKNNFGNILQSIMGAADQSSPKNSKGKKKTLSDEIIASIQNYITNKIKEVYDRMGLFAPVCFYFFYILSFFLTLKELCGYAEYYFPSN